MEPKDYAESCCPFDGSMYTGTPDSAPCPVSLPVRRVIEELDRLYEQDREAEAQGFLESWQERAAREGDWRGELSFTSELLGQYRRSGDKDKGLAAVDRALRLIREHSMGQTLSGATVLLNAATTLKCFGKAAESLPIFRHVSWVYSQKLDPMDYRFAGLYNNMALSCADVEDLEGAERYFTLALKIMESCENPGNDMAVTYCNMAEMYAGRDMEDERIERCMERAWELLNDESLPRDGYHAFTISKCAPSFDYFGYFLYAKELRERAEKIYAGT